ncbi:hypothetical protein EVG20_g10311 [Dentipellis fragilis]|uniref:Uncharacterized protein n=1 Tax=Dentipellis fragilis TaxID=205917 RepID=A0A4Y9XV24_9AGAM|nr:hypothetical protein EVG20_g10311 [Dentipellis fragilis]
MLHPVPSLPHTFALRLGEALKDIYIQLGSRICGKHLARRSSRSTSVGSDRHLEAWVEGLSLRSIPTFSALDMAAQIANIHCLDDLQRSVVNVNEKFVNVFEAF